MSTNYFTLAEILKFPLEKYGLRPVESDNEGVLVTSYYSDNFGPNQYYWGLDACPRINGEIEYCLMSWGIDDEEDRFPAEYKKMMEFVAEVNQILGREIQYDIF